jgi:hypothetical protein
MSPKLPMIVPLLLLGCAQPSMTPMSLPAPAMLSSPVARVSPSPWRVRCQENSVTTEIRCEAERASSDALSSAAAAGQPGIKNTMGSLGVILYRGQDGKWVGPLVSVPHDWPGNENPAIVRVDDNAPAALTLSPSRHQQIIEQMKRGRVAFVQASFFPYRNDTMFAVDLAGLEEAIVSVTRAAAERGYQPKAGGSSG